MTIPILILRRVVILKYIYIYNKPCDVQKRLKMVNPCSRSRSQRPKSNLGTPPDEGNPCLVRRNPLSCVVRYDACRPDPLGLSSVYLLPSNHSVTRRMSMGRCGSVCGDAPISGFGTEPIGFGTSALSWNRMVGLVHFFGYPLC